MCSFDISQPIHRSVFLCRASRFLTLGFQTCLAGAEKMIKDLTPEVLEDEDIEQVRMQKCLFVVNFFSSDRRAHGVCVDPGEAEAFERFLP